MKKLFFILRSNPIKLAVAAVLVAGLAWGLTRLARKAVIQQAEQYGQTVGKMKVYQESQVQTLKKIVVLDREIERLQLKRDSLVSTSLESLDNNAIQKILNEEFK